MYIVAMPAGNKIELYHSIIFLRDNVMDRIKDRKFMTFSVAEKIREFGYKRGYNIIVVDLRKTTYGVVIEGLLYYSRIGCPYKKLLLTDMCEIRRLKAERKIAEDFDNFKAYIATHSIEAGG